MKFVLALGAVLAATFAAPGAYAFTQSLDDGFSSKMLETKLADPDDIVSLSEGRPSAGKTFKLGKDSTFSLQITGPTGYDPQADSSPFLRDPASSTVPSKRQGW